MAVSDELQKLARYLFEAREVYESRLEMVLERRCDFAGWPLALEDAAREQGAHDAVQDMICLLVSLYGVHELLAIHRAWEAARELRIPF